jgi:hypothetical protein
MIQATQHVVRMTNIRFQPPLSNMNSSLFDLTKNVVDIVGQQLQLIARLIRVKDNCMAIPKVAVHLLTNGSAWVMIVKYLGDLS